MAAKEKEKDLTSGIESVNVGYNTETEELFLTHDEEPVFMATYSALKALLQGKEAAVVETELGPLWVKVSIEWKKAS